MPFLQSGIFVRHDPETASVPLVVDVSRSGRVYPKEFRSPLAFTVLHDNVSMYVEDLWAGAPSVGATMLYCCFPNTFMDVNRKEDDLDPAVIDGQWPTPLNPTPVAIRGLGLIKTKSRYGEPMQERKLTVAEIQERFDVYYHPYHRELKRIVDETHAKHGLMWQLSCHCMSAVGAPTHADAGQPRAHLVVRDLGREKGGLPLDEGMIDVRPEPPEHGGRILQVPVPGRQDLEQDEVLRCQHANRLAPEGAGDGPVQRRVREAR